MVSLLILVLSVQPLLFVLPLFLVPLAGLPTVLSLIAFENRRFGAVSLAGYGLAVAAFMFAGFHLRTIAGNRPDVGPFVLAGSLHVLAFLSLATVRARLRS